MMKLKEAFLGIPEVKAWSENLKQPGRHLLTGLSGSAKTLFLAENFTAKKVSQIVVCDDLYHAQQLVDDLENVLPPAKVHLFPVEEMMASEMATSSPEFKAQRVLALDALTSEEPQIVVTSLSGIRRFLPQKELWQQSKFELKLGQEYDLTQLVEKLHQMGYMRQKQVERPGDFALRGSILDIFLLGQDVPVRADFFDTELDSLRTFSVADQRSLANITEIEVLPATDFIATKEDLQQAAQALEKASSKQKDATEFIEVLSEHVARFNKGDLAASDLALAEYIYPQKTSLFDYLATDGLVVFDDYPRLREKEKQLCQEEQQWQVDQLAKKRLLPKAVLANNLSDLEKKLKCPEIFLALFQKGMGRLRFVQQVDVKARMVQQFFGQMPLLKAEATRWQESQETVVLLVGTKERQAKTLQTLADFGIEALLSTTDDLQPGKVQIALGTLNSGFELPQIKLIVLSENELFAQKTRKQPKRQTMSNAERLKSYTDLKKGDYIVHVNHGIGRFMGMQTLEVGGKHQDYMTIVYQDDAQLFIPVSQLDRIQKYVSAEGKAPRINKLGGNKWAKTKSKVAAKIEDIADELVELYAKREANKGHAFPPDDSYQHEFEAAFPFSETPDQLRSVKEIKADMQKERPMDRLLIGDVGYGKTEVALRAVFKAIEDGKQVAFLAPTTVLAQQHYETMVSRFEGFPVNVGILSRFSTKKQIEETLKALKTGECDAVVGTHRLLSQDVKFADLGLLIIDEEQRFGVKHKERLKKLKSSVDVLTLTATPIPRTLNMSMLGVRDLSVIETAPMNRYPIQTYVMEQNYGVIVDGIRREMARGGQVFYLHNRVDDIEKKVEELQALVPEAKIAYIHGQMTENQLEGILMDFIAGQYDVLVTTTIIETGVDIPNANTLFVENADKMGLAQLYQLRGRVGRSNRVAYAYFMYQPDKVLTEVSEKRLEAIKDFTELGSGFKIAMRDLSIRGAGNLLGKQQHGFIDSVGYELYTQMLNEAVAKKRGVKPQAKTDCQIDLDLEAYLPESYLEDARQKIEIYKRIHQMNSKEQYEEIKEDLLDRFGEYPTEVATLLEIGLLKLYADHALVESITQVGANKVQVELASSSQDKYDAAKLVTACDDLEVGTSFSNKDKKTLINVTFQPRQKDILLPQLQQLMFNLMVAIDNSPRVEETVK